MRSLPSAKGRWIRRGSTLLVLDLDGPDRDAEPAAPAQEWEGWRQRSPHRQHESGARFSYDEVPHGRSPRWQHESGARFSYDDVPPIVVALLDAGLVDRALQEAVRHGDDNVNHLTDLVFFKLYPDRQGRFIATSDPDYAAMSRTWNELRDNMVKAALEHVRAFPTPTKAPCYQPPARAAGISRVWIFATVPLAEHNFPGFVVARYRAGFTDIAFEVNDKPDSKKPIGSFILPPVRLQALRKLIPEFCHLGIDVHLMCWLQPQAAFLQQAAQAMRPLCQTLPVRSLLFDLEEPWTKFTNQDQTRALLASSWPFAGWPCLLGATSTTNLPKSVGVVAERCNYLLPQAYSTNELGERPGNTQEAAVREWGSLITPARPLVMGLAAYDLNLKAPPEKGTVVPPRALTEKQAMQRAIVAAEKAGAREVAYWSLTHLKATGAEKRAEFVLEAARKARAGLSQTSPVP